MFKEPVREILCRLFQIDFRDKQRFKVYAAEKELKSSSWDTRIKYNYLIESFLFRIIKSNWYKEYKCNFYPIAFIRMEHRHKKDGIFFVGTNKKKIWCSFCSFGTEGYLLTILHEFAHMMVQNGLREYKDPGHGIYFTITLLDLVERWINKQAMVSLKFEFDRRGIKYYK